MKRWNNLYQKIISVDNLKQADVNARKGKTKKRCVINHDNKRDANILALHDKLKNKTYRTSKYKTFTIKDPKERVIYKLPYIDRVLHHAIMIVTKDIFVSTFTSDTYSCIKGRGIHAASNAVKRALNDVENTKYCLKIDIQKFYPSIEHDVLKKLLRKKFKDKDLLWLFDEIIDSAEGLPIGNYLSQYLANFYLAYFDHWIKESQGVVNYMRYADDMVFFSGCKMFLHRLLGNIKNYLWDNLKLVLKKNWQVFHVAIRGVDFLGYVFFHEYTKIRKKIKKGFSKMLRYNPNHESISSYLSWLKHANCINLKNKLLYVRAA